MSNDPKGKMTGASRYAHLETWTLVMSLTLVIVLSSSLISTSRIAEQISPMAESVELALRQRIQRDIRQFKAMQGGLIAVTLVLGLLVMAVIHLYEKRKKRNVAALRKQEAKYRNFFENSSDAMLILENDKFIDCNAAAVAILGYADKQEVLNTPPAELSPKVQPDGRESIEKAGELMKRARERGALRFEWMHRKKSGEEFPVEVSLTAIESRSGTQLHTLWRDLTDRKRTEQALADNENRLTGILRVAPAGIGVVKNLTFTAVNPRMCDMTGYSREELIGQKVHTLYATEEEDSRVGETLLRQIQEEETGSVETQWKRKDGLLIDVILSLAPIDRSGSTLGGTFTALDITDRKHAETALRESEERYRMLIECQTDLVVKVAPDGRFLFVSPSYCRMFGKTEEELLGKTFLPLVHEEDRATTEEAMSSLFNPPYEAYMEQRAQTKDGWRWLAWQDSAIRDENGEVTAIIGVGRDITGIKEAEDALRSSEGKFRMLVEASSDWVWELDENGAFSYASPQVEAMLGYTPEELIGKTPFDLMAPEEAGRVQVVFDELREKAETMIRMENVNLHRDGREVVLESSGVPILDENGRVSGYRGVDRDITDRKLADVALKEYTQKLALHVEQTPLGVITWNTEFEVTEWNPAAEKIFGYTREEAEGQRASFIIPDAAREQIDKVLGQLIENTGGRRSTNENVTKAGDRILCDWYNTTLVDDNGRMIGAASLVMDITARKKAAEERERLTLAIEQSAEMVIITDADAQILYVNPAFERGTGYSREEVLGQNPRILQSGQHTPAFYSKMWHAISSGKSWSGQLINKRKDGSIYTEETTISPVTDELGKIVNYVAAKHDATHELELETQLRQAQKMEAVGQMAGGIAHDFNNLLQVISGYVELSQMTMKDTNPNAVALDEIGKAALRGKGLINQLLAFSRRQVIKPVDIDLNALIEPILNMVRGLIGEQATLDFIPGHSLGTVHADRGLLEQVLMNLCANARDAMPESGKVTIETENVLADETFVESHAWAKPGHYVLLSVTDTGHGMDRSTQEHIFEPFFTTKGVGKGTGLGLSTVFGIVKQHEGNISVCSEVGEGAVFRVYLPAADSNLGEEVRPDPAPAVGGTETILVAEDDETVLRLTEHLLTDAGYRVLSALDGEEALEVFRQHSKEIDMVMFDVVMPRMGGREAIEEIQKLRPGLPHLFASGYSENAVRTNFCEGRELHLLNKPYQADTLLRKIREVLDAE